MTALDATLGHVAVNETVRSPLETVAALREPGQPSLFLDPATGFAEGWSVGPLVAVRPRATSIAPDAPIGSAIDRLASSVEARRRRGGTPHTGIAALLSYEAVRPDRLRNDPLVAGLPALAILEVDRAIHFPRPGQAWVTVRDGSDAGRQLDRIRRLLETPASAAQRPPRPARVAARPVTSLPREAYLDTVRRTQERIAEGEIYQANLCQRIRVGCSGDAFRFWAEQSARTPAPRSAWLEVGELALASCSPETLVDVQPTGRVETRPIKGTRPRGATAEADERARRDLLGSAKDRAELLMIVDLERNDLGRICHIGSVETLATAELRTYPEVHHLVGHVRGQLRPEVGAAGILDAVFPGGSITGAPKLRAIEILETLEPVPRSFFTGSLFWFGDDGTTESSILIRTVVFAGDTALIGAGGGIVADSDPEAEREESNHKIRALAHGLGFDPGEAE